MSSSSSQNSSEPSDPLRTLVGASLGFLFGLFLSKLKSPIKETVKSVYEQDSTYKAREAGENVSRYPVRVVIDSLPPKSAPSKEHQAKEHLKKRLKILEAIVGVLTLAIASLLLFVTAKYAHYAKQQRDEMIRQNNLIQRNFRRQTRPFLQVASIKINDSKIIATVSNYGQTPARHVELTGQVRESETNWSVYTCDVSGDKSIIARTGIKAIFPSDRSDIEIPIESHATIESGKFLAVCVSYQDIEGAFLVYRPTI